MQCSLPALGHGCHFLRSDCLISTASPTADRACRVLRCSLLTFCRPGEALHAVLLTLFIVISTAVHAEPLHLFAPANIMLECSGASHKVRRRNPLKSLILRSMRCCSLLCRASCALGPRYPASATRLREKWQPRPHPRLNSISCSPAPSEVSGCFVLVDKEGLAQERRHWSASAHPCSDTVGLVVCATVRETCSL